MKNKLTIVPAMPMRSASVHAELENAALDYNCFDEFVADLDKILSTFNAIDAALNNGEGEGPGLDDYSVRSIVDMRLKPLKAKCDAFYDLFNRDEKHDGNRLKREIVADRLSQLLTSFPVNGPKAPMRILSLSTPGSAAADGSTIVPAMMQAAVAIVRARIDPRLSGIRGLHLVP